MEKDSVIGGLIGRIGTAVGGVSGGVVASDHNAVAQGALLALAGVAIDLGFRWLREFLKRGS